MPQAQLIQNSFNSGELSPLAIGRSDTQPYKHALAKCRNMIPTPVGPVVKRTGSQFVSPVADEGVNSRLINFSYSNIQSYILEFADGQIRFFTPANGGGWIIPGSYEFDDQRIDTSLNTIGLDEPHYYQDGAGPFQLTTTDTLPTGLSIDTDYYIVLLAASAGAASFGLSTTQGGSAENITGAGSGTHTITPADSVIQAVDSPYSISEVWELDFVPSGDILYITHENHPPYQLERWAANGFRMREMFLIDGPWEDINKSQSMTMDPSAPPIGLTQSEPHTFRPADVSITGETPGDAITIPNHGYLDGEGPLEIKTTGTLPGVVLALNTAYYVQKLNDHQFKLNALPNDGTPLALSTRGTGIHTLEGLNKDTLLMSGDFFNTDSPSTDIGRRFRYRDGIDTSGSPQWAWGIISEVTDAKNADVQPHRAWSGDAEQWVFRMGAFYPGNYPSFCTIHEQRLWFAATPGRPNALWGSQIGNFQNFAPDEGVDDYSDLSRVVTDASAIHYTLGAGQVDKLAWMAAVRQLIVSTTGAIWPIQANSFLEAITQSTINSRPSAVTGSALVKPVRVSDEIIYSSVSSHKLLAIGFDFERDAFVPQDLSILASHFTESPITQMAFADEPYSVVWCCREDGLLLGITYERSQRVLGWHAHEVGGTDPKVRSVAVAKSDDLNYDQLWMVVQRTINGQTRRYIEFLRPPFYTNTALEDAPFLDSSLLYDGTPTTTISGLNHLEAETVYALADGAWVGNLTVTGGSVTLPNEASKILIGLNYNSYIKTLPLEAEGVPGGTLIDRNKRLLESWMRLHRTNYVQVGKDIDNMKLVRMRKISNDPAEPTPLQTIDVNLLTDHGVGVDQSFYVGSDKPVPLDLIGLTGRIEWGAR